MGSWLGLSVLGNIGTTMTCRACRPARCRMIHGGRLEGYVVVVTATAIRCGSYRRNMHRSFAQRSHAMAGIAGTGCRWRVAKGSSGPGGGAAVTGVTLRGGADMG